MVAPAHALVVSSRVHRVLYTQLTLEVGRQIICYTVTVFATALTTPAKLEIVNLLVCQDVHGMTKLSLDASDRLFEDDQQPPCASDPKVQAQAAAIFACTIIINSCGVRDIS